MKTTYGWRHLIGAVGILFLLSGCRTIKDGTGGQVPKTMSKSDTTGGQVPKAVFKPDSTGGHGPKIMSMSDSTGGQHPQKMPHLLQAARISGQRYLVQIGDTTGGGGGPRYLVMELAKSDNCPCSPDKFNLVYLKDSTGGQGPKFMSKSDTTGGQ